MQDINMGSVVKGGLVAGLIINVVEMVVNVFVLGKQWEAVMKDLGKSSEMTGSQIAVLNLWGFAAGIVTIWLYAAIRPRFGPGPKTAVCAALAVWFLAYFSGGFFPVVFGVYPAGLMAAGAAIGLVEVIVAALAGARIYKEA